MNVNSVIGLEYQDPESFETPIVANPQFENCYCRDHVLFEFNSFHRMAQLLHINRSSGNVCIAKSCNMGNGLVHHMTRCEYDYVHFNIWEYDNNIWAIFHNQLPRGTEHMPHGFFCFAESFIILTYWHDEFWVFFLQFVHFIWS